MRTEYTRAREVLGESISEEMIDEAPKFKKGVKVKLSDVFMKALENKEEDKEKQLDYIKKAFDDNKGVMEVDEDGTAKEGWIQVKASGTKSPITGIPKASFLDIIKEEIDEAKERITVKVTFSDGNFLTTEINTDLEGAKKYYLGKMFNMASGEEDDKMVKAVKVEEV